MHVCRRRIFSLSWTPYFYVRDESATDLHSAESLGTQKPLALLGDLCPLPLKQVGNDLLAVTVRVQVLCPCQHLHTHTHTHARTHARTHAHTQTHTHTDERIRYKHNAFNLNVCNTTTLSYRKRKRRDKYAFLP